MTVLVLGAGSCCHCPALFRSNAALLCGPSWAAPHVVGAQCTVRRRRVAWPLQLTRYCFTSRHYCTIIFLQTPPLLCV